MRHLVRVQEERGGDDFIVVGITDAPADQIEEFRDEHGLNFPVLSEAASTREAFGIEMIWGSEFYLVDPQERIVARGFDASLDELDVRLGP